MPPRPDDRESLSRARLVEAGLGLLREEGLDALSMRGLADRLGVKAASLYWHVRDRRELYELLAEGFLEQVRPAAGTRDWRAAARAQCQRLETAVAGSADFGRLVLEAPGALQQSAVHRALTAVLAGRGLGAGEARATATMMLGYVLVTAGDGPPVPGPLPGRPAAVAVDSGSRGVTLRAGNDMPELVRIPPDRTTAAPAVVRGDTVVVRRLRGVGRGEIELNPRHPWSFRIQGPTWNTVLDLTGLDVRELKLDSGAARVEAILPPPRGEVPIQVSGGVVGVRLRRPPGVAVVADLSAGAVQVRLDAFSVGAAATDLHWESAGGAGSGDHYRLVISGGAVRVTLEQDASIRASREPLPETPPRAGGDAALEVVLDGVAARG